MTVLPGGTTTAVAGATVPGWDCTITGWDWTMTGLGWDWTMTGWEDTPVGVVTSISPATFFPYGPWCLLHPVIPTITKAASVKWIMRLFIISSVSLCYKYETLFLQHSKSID